MDNNNTSFDCCGITDSHIALTRPDTGRRRKNLCLYCRHPDQIRYQRQEGRSGQLHMKAERILFKYIEICLTREGDHSANGWKSPADGMQK